ncbi:T9SS type A sorting domain-containing protein [Winogradskyella sp.]|uniref:T9SS type A sorting domain-containing protein n=1 Tax=Winogradskyella sp. TaxID=1883156 RepID=UPI0025EDCC70|nr:T9SS type A sorting domain-containing protein [Winogradskyella sp.]
MKKITLLILCLALTTFGFSQVDQNFGTSGQDSAPTVLTINDTDITVNGADPITAISLGTFTSHYNSATGSTTQCGNWYDFILAVTGGAADGTSIQGCDADFTGLDVTGFTTITLTSNDLDGTDTVFFDIDLSVTFTLSSTPDCDASLDVTTDVDPAGDISWNAATGAVDNYDVIVGTASGLSDVYSATLGNVLTTNVGALTDGTTYYVTITPSNSVGPATGCVEQTFTTWMIPVNDECSGAITIACAGQYTGNTGPASPEVDDPGTCTTTAGTAGAVWYTFIGANSADAGAANGSPGDNVTLDLSLSTFDTKIRVFRGVCGDLTCEGGDDDGGDGTTSLFAFDTTVGQEYYVLVHGYLTNAGAYTLDVSCVPPPACVPATFTVADGGNNCPTEEYFVDVDVTALGTGASVDITANGVAFEIGVGIGTYSVGPYGASTLVDIIVEDAAGDTCNGTDSITTPTACPPPPPMNVDCANAAPITCDETINATSVGSTGTSEDIGCTMGVNGIWYTFVGTGGDMTVSVDASFDHRVGIASGSCGALANIVCDDQSTGNENHTFASTLAETYYVYVAHFSGGNTTTGTIDITLTCAVVPTCTQAVVDSSTIVESCNPDGSGTFTIDHVISNAGDAGTVLDDGITTYPVVVGTVTTGPYMSGDSVTVELTGVDSDCDFTVGTFDFTCPQPAPVNDEISGAITLLVGDTVCENIVAGTNQGATDSIENDNEASCSSSDPAGDVWFSVTVPSTGELTIEISSSITAPIITDTVMEVYSGTSGALVEIECDDDDAAGNLSLVELTGLTPGDVLLVRVWEWQNNFKGNFNICAWSPSSLGVEDNTFDGFSYFPNPVKDVLTLNAQNTIEDVKIYNVLGQVILSATPNAVNSDVDMSALSTGAYFVQVTIANTTKTIRVIKQ